MFFNNVVGEMKNMKFEDNNLIHSDGAFFLYYYKYHEPKQCYFAVTFLQIHQITLSNDFWSEHLYNYDKRE